MTTIWTNLLLYHHLFTTYLYDDNDNVSSLLHKNIKSRVRARTRNDRIVHEWGVWLTSNRAQQTGGDSNDQTTYKNATSQHPVSFYQKYHVPTSVNVYFTIQGASATASNRGRSEWRKATGIRIDRRVTIAIARGHQDRPRYPASLFALFQHFPVKCLIVHTCL